MLSFVLASYLLLFTSSTGVIVAATGILDSISLTENQQLTVVVDPPSGSSFPSKATIFVKTLMEAFPFSSSIVDATVYYAFNGHIPTLASPRASIQSPYIQIDTSTHTSRIRNITMIAVVPSTAERSPPFSFQYIVEGLFRPSSYGFFVPGTESGGYVAAVKLEMNASVLAKAYAGNGIQQLADYYSYQGVGTYHNQVSVLDLLAIDSDLIGFEGGFSVNISQSTQHYGIFVPYTNGVNHVGKVVRIDLKKMVNNTSACQQSYYIEHSPSNITASSPTTTLSNACVVVLSLVSLHPQAVGFVKGFSAWPFVYLSPGQHAIGIRLDIRDFQLTTTTIVDLNYFSSSLGGYSSGFVDGSWACFSPYRSFSGPVGGVRSPLFVDKNHLTVYYHSQLTCVNESAWLPASTYFACTNNSHNNTNNQCLSSAMPQLSSVQVLDLNLFDSDLVGFSDVIKVGRYAYFSPFQKSPSQYTSKLLRVALGEKDIGSTIAAFWNQYNNFTNHTQQQQFLVSCQKKDTESSSLINDHLISVLDLRRVHSLLGGCSSLFSLGKYILTVPFRSQSEALTGERGYGVVAQINMNVFFQANPYEDIVVVDLTKTTRRQQVPFIADEDLRGFSGGFASGKFAFFVPFYNRIFSGKVARLELVTSTTSGAVNNSALAATVVVQELDLCRDRVMPNTLRGYRGAFVSQWQAVWP